jgi:hypothetical protein
LRAMASESGGVRLSSEDLEEIEGEFGNFGKSWENGFWDKKSIWYLL